MQLLSQKQDAYRDNHQRDKTTALQAAKARVRAIVTQIVMVELIVTLIGWRTTSLRHSNSTMKTLTTRERLGRNMRTSSSRWSALRSSMDSYTLVVISSQGIRKRFRNLESLMWSIVLQTTLKTTTKTMESSTSLTTWEITPRRILHVSSTTRFNLSKMHGTKVEKFMSTVFRESQDLLQSALLIWC